MRVVATVTEPVAVKKILSHLGGGSKGPLPRARASDPTRPTGFGFDAP